MTPKRNPPPLPDVITGYFEADARRDTDAILALFAEDAVVVDEGETHRGISKIRAWREGPASRYEYTTEVFDTDRISDDEYLVTGRIEGNFPGGTAELRWRFTVVGDRIGHLHIAP
jgi:ketosteroid isomerase-like protein